MSGTVPIGCGISGNWRRSVSHQLDYHSTRLTYKAEISARFCSNATTELTCCLPCPITHWVFADKFDAHAPVANYVSIAAFVCNVLLLLTFAVVPEEKSHRHYLSVSMTVSLLLLALAFIIPLGTKPDLCYNDITPHNMHSDMSCAWTGALFLAGAMGVIVWSELCYMPLPSS